MEKIRILDKEFEIREDFAIQLKQLLEIYCDAQIRYGNTAWNSLGSKGIFVDFNRKYQRIKHYVWEDNRQMSSEKIEDTLYDCAIYVLFLIASLGEEIEQ